MSTAEKVNLRPVGEDHEFKEFFLFAEPRLRRSLVALYGPDRGRDAAAEALLYAWEHWLKIRAMEHPVAYLHRVGRSRSRRRKEGMLWQVPGSEEPYFEPRLLPALRRLSERQRLAVVLADGYGWSLREIAEIAEIKIPTVQKHLERGRERLRREMSGGRDV